MSRLVLLLLASFGLVSSAPAQSLVATFSFGGAHFATHPSASLMYVSVPALNSVAVIDTETLTLVDTIFVGSNPQGLALSPSADRLFVCTTGAQALAVVDTHTRTLLPSIPLPHLPYDVEVGTNGRAFVTPNGPGYYGIMQVDTSTGAFINEFELGVFVYYSGLVEISPDRQRLYFANRGLSPGTLACFDVSTTTASLVWHNDHGALGSNGTDLGLSADGAFVSYACGSGNQNYDIFKISTTTFASVGTFNTGPYPREVVYSPDGNVVYTVHGAQIDRFNANTFLPYSNIVTSAEPSELAVDRTGRFIFAAFENQTRVYTTGFGLGTSTSFCAGDGSGTACPCGNQGLPGRGCDNSFLTGGAQLTSTGEARVSADTLVLTTTGLPPIKPGIYFQGQALLVNGMGASFGDGLRCVGGTIHRLGTVDSSSGQSSYPSSGDPAISVQGSVPAISGTTRYYQLWYRNSFSYCTSDTFNFSNAIAVAWLP